MHIDPFIVFGRCVRCGGSLLNGHRCPQDLVQMTPEQIEAIRIAVAPALIRDCVAPVFVTAPPVTHEPMSGLKALEVMASPFMAPAPVRGQPPQWFVDIYAEHVAKYFPNSDFDASG